MNIYYNDKTDLLYIRLADEKHSVTNKRISEEIVVDVDEKNKLVGIEILDASKNIDLSHILPVTYITTKKAV